ncbi:hypothetical protein [Nitrospirillum viridazoti]|uniref:Uncharacterized protein n=1 Tax=Nitrospirillum viridazoti CBAmc TaxID=1441467 RepID=A0A248JV97_9PROT|nr:hypothetical protein [Nitrospirillum amazonense]ASG22144.1 hypothetical protein Y958_14290 [Nitrospirillum amazonense CBAmc]TWB32716.1 hypothetical protein FBZ91_11644 [Nitrospirillum amazonense]
MPGKTSTPIGPHPSPLPLYLRLLRGGTLVGQTPLADDSDAAVSVPRQMTGGACGGQMMAGRAEDPALVHF